MRGGGDFYSEPRLMRFPNLLLEALDPISSQMEIMSRLHLSSRSAMQLHVRRFGNMSSANSQEVSFVFLPLLGWPAKTALLFDQVLIRTCSLITSL